MKTETLPGLLACAALALVACAVDDGTTDNVAGCEGGKCDGFDEDEDDIRDTPCDGTLRDESGRDLGTGKIAGRMNDPLARLAFGEGDSCPTAFSDIVAKLVDAGCSNHETMLVSETAQILEQATEYRAVTFLQCDIDGQQSEVWFSAFGIQGTDNPIPQAVEMIAFDPVEGVFDYYEGKGPNTIDFFGTSKDFVLEGAGEGLTRRCAGCHTGGGLIMKELAAPWLHWEGDFNTPGSNELIDNNADLFGSHSNGIALESLVLDGNDKWNETRLAMFRDGLGSGTTVARLLQPLFCTVEVQFDSSFSSSVSSGNLGNAVTDTTLGGFGSVRFTQEQYEAVLEANGSRVAGLPGEHRDTLGGLPFISRGAADKDFQDKLLAAGIVDQEFVEDVLLVDFTRSIFSTDRCELLEFAPELDADDATADQIRDGFIANLEAASPSDGTPAADLLRNLRSDADNARDTVGAFQDACSNRTDNTDAGGTEVPGALVDYMRYISHVREQAADLQVFEFPQTMPTDSLSTPTGTRLSPVDCTPITDYVSVTPASDDLPPPPDDGGSSTTGGDGGDGDDCCRTCVTSQACGDSCISADATCNSPPGCACQG